MISKHHGELTEGCKRCAKGEKLVLFVTGICPRVCVYCPLSNEKFNKDVTFANESQVKDIKDLIEEVKISGATGAGITGGDPLARFERTCEYIKALKKEFGKDFHIHLYTSLDLLTPEKIKQLEEAGLDELRVHPDLEDKTLWSKLDMLKDTKMETVIEVPALPKKEKEILELIKYAKDKVNAFNLNELELAQTKISEFAKQKWKTNKDTITIKGSEKTAKNVIKKARGWHVRVHYCSAQFKDEVQFTERLKNYAKIAALPRDIITDSGMLFRGAIYSDTNIKKLKQKYPDETFTLDKEKSRILCSARFVRDHKNEIPKCALVEEYPTPDKTENYKEFLS
ncbi:MAG: radical SAM protein [Nanoarchaeota archaeon]|nr:radical SAM protein [Nanoarchaeota archaeon]MBU1052029.1 radical SAM protein [Nanoarchaeota archaeon]MBU1987884.1 radical SAM protein [Nanoarchaeota archaeon]